MRTHPWEKAAVEGRSSLIPSGTVRSVHTIKKRLMTPCPSFAGDMAKLFRLEDLVETKPYKQLHREWKQMFLLSLFKKRHSLLTSTLFITCFDHLSLHTNMQTISVLLAGR